MCLRSDDNSQRPGFLGNSLGTPSAVRFVCEALQAAEARSQAQALLLRSTLPPAVPRWALGQRSPTAHLLGPSRQHSYGCEGQTLSLVSFPVNRGRCIYTDPLLAPFKQRYSVYLCRTIGATMAIKMTAHEFTPGLSVDFSPLERKKAPPPPASDREPPSA